MNTKSSLDLARELLRIESRAIEAAASRLDDQFTRAVDLICKAHQNHQKIIFLGVGKSHYVGRKLAASFMSTGVTALFLHPSEALHGDLGILRPGDVCILISKSGGTSEILSILPFFKGRNPTIAITGQSHSIISAQCDIALDASVEKEACPNNILPTASTTVALAIGDALVASVAAKTGFTREDFALYHPGGSLGKRLNHKVSEVLQPLARCAQATRTTSLKDVAQLMSEKPMGACCVLNDQSQLEGIITEGDLRRAIARGLPMTTAAAEVMTKDAVSLAPDMLIEDALSIMERPQRKIGSAPVLDNERKVLGLVRIHDLV